MRLKSALCLCIIFTLGARSAEVSDTGVDVDVVDSAELADIEPDDIANFDDSELTNLTPDPNRTIALEGNTTAPNNTRKHVKCKEILYNATVNEETEPAVELINGTQLSKLLTANPEVTSRDKEADCVLVMFYSKFCPFSTQAAPHYNALARTYPNIKIVALDALKYHGINAQYGIVGVPTIKLFHNGRPVGKYNGTEYNIHSFSKFVNILTGHEPNQLVVLSKDFRGPVSSEMENDVDYFLIISWLFIITCSIYYFGKSRWWKTIVETIQNNWRESEAQHEHAD